MSSLDLSPSPGPAPRPQRVRAHALTEATLLARNGEQILLALVIPVAILVGGHFLGARVGLRIDTLAPSVLGLALWSSAFTSVAIATGFERSYGVLERLAATPLTRSGLVVGKALGLGLIALGQVAVLIVVALLLGWRPGFTAGSLLVALVAAVLASAAYASLALAMAGVLKPEITLALANLVYLAGLALGAVIWPTDAYPPVLHGVVAALPTAALGEAFREGAAGTAAWWSLPILAIWAVVGSLVARKVFRWTS
ncbi:ABC transporter permease [Mariniluteicoccus endophyticus]